MLLRSLIIGFVALIINTSAFSQGCCSGGAGSPIAGGAATGVLQENQMEVSANYQYNKSNKFFAEHKDTTSLFNSLFFNPPTLFDIMYETLLSI